MLRVDEGGLQKDKDCELICIRERDLERRVSYPDGQADDRGKLELVTIRARLPWKGRVAYKVALPARRKVGLPHEVVTRARIHDDRVGPERLTVRGYRADDVVDLR